MPPDTAVSSIKLGAELRDHAADRLAVAEAVPVRRGGTVLVVDFHREGNSADYRTFGWSGQEESHVWSLQASCGLRLPAQPAASALTIELDLQSPPEPVAA